MVPDFKPQDDGPIEQSTLDKLEHIRKCARLFNFDNDPEGNDTTTEIPAEVEEENEDDEESPAKLESIEEKEEDNQ